MHGALLAVALAAGVILGMIGMHSLDTHGTAHAGAVGSYESHATVVDDADVVVSAGHADAVAGMEPAASAAGSLAAAACVLGLLAGALLLLLPRSSETSSALRVPLDGARSTAVGVMPRAPSLHVLCISRR